MLVANISQFRKDLKFYIDSVTDNHDTLIVNGNGKTVVVMSLDDYNEMDATDYITSTASNKASLDKSIEQLKKGKTITKTFEELEQLATTKSKAVL
jgi:antitoxin YefM